MQGFKHYFNESQNYLTEIESKLLQLNPTKFKTTDKERLSIMYQPNFKEYRDQQDITSSYTRGSLYDSLYSYRESKDVVAHVVKSISAPDIEDFSKSYQFEFEGKTYNLNISVPMVKLYSRYADTKQFNSVPEFKDITNRMLIDMDGKSFSFNTFKSRTGVEAPLTLKNEMSKDIKDACSLIISSQREHENIVRNTIIKMLDAVIEDYLDSSIKTDVDTMKMKLKDAKTADDFKHMLRDFGFEGIPNDDKVLNGMMSDKNYSYSQEKPDGYGHQTGFSYTVNFSKKRVVYTGWSSDD